MSSEQTTTMIIPNRADCVYTVGFCEENIWHLAKLFLETNKSTPDIKCFVIFMINSKNCVHLWKQKNKYEDGLMFWDYLVFMIVEHQGQTIVFDMDTTLPFPVPFLQYATEAIKCDFFDKRIVEAEKFLLQFSSDRGQMLEGEQWMLPPPSYPPILNEAKVHNLDNFISMESSDEFGEVLDLKTFVSRFS